MRIRLTRLSRTQTRFGVFHNCRPFADRLDRATVGGWYFHLHFWPFWLESYSTVTVNRKDTDR